MYKSILLGASQKMKMKYGLTDVRDSARSYYQALMSPEAGSQRFIVLNETIWLGDITVWLK